jgi:hypothetical protein
MRPMFRKFATNTSGAPLRRRFLGSVASGIALMGFDAHAASRRPAHIAHVDDFVASTPDHSSAANAAFASLPPEGGEVVFSGGDFILATPLLGQDKSVTVRGAGVGVTNLIVAHNGTALSIVQHGQNGLGRTVNIRDLTLRALRDGGTAIEIGYDKVDSWPLPTATIENVGIFPVFAEKLENSGAWTVGIRLRNAWQPRLRRISFCGRPEPGAHPSPISAFIECDGTVELIASDCEAYYADTVVRQASYCEGINFDCPIVVACNWMIKQEQHYPGPLDLKLNGIWVSGGEINTFRGVFKLERSFNALITGTEFNRFLDSGEDYAVFDLTDCQNWAVSAARLNSAHAAATATAIRLRTTSPRHATSGNCFVGLILTGFGKSCDLGRGTIRNIVQATVNEMGATPEMIAGTNLSNVYIDHGTDNSISWTTNGGWTAHSADLIGIAGRQGQLLAGVDNVEGAANHVRLTAAATGSAPSIGFSGDPDASGAIAASGAGRIALRNGRGPIAELGGGGANHLRIVSGPQGEPVRLETAGPGAATPLSLAPQGEAAVLLGGPLAPGRDDALALGGPKARFASAWITTGVIQTSDPAFKRDVTACLLGRDFINRLRPVSYRRTRGQPEEARMAPAMRAETRTIETVELVDGRAVLRRENVMEMVPAVDLLPLFDEAGQPALGPDGRQRMHPVPRMARVEPQHPQPVDDGLYHGFLAPEVGEAGACADGRFAGYVASPEVAGLISTELIAPLVAAFQELDAIVRAQAEIIARLTSQATDERSGAGWPAFAAPFAGELAQGARRIAGHPGAIGDRAGHHRPGMDHGAPADAQRAVGGPVHDGRIGADERFFFHGHMARDHSRGTDGGEIAEDAIVADTGERHDLHMAPDARSGADEGRIGDYGPFANFDIRRNGAPWTRRQ